MCIYRGKSDPKMVSLDTLVPRCATLVFFTILVENHIGQEPNQIHWLGSMLNL